MKCSLYSLCAAGFLAACSSSPAATATWKGGTVGLFDTWNISTNWQSSIGPGGNDVVFPASGAWIGMMQNTDATVNSLAINASGYGFNDSGAIGGGLKIAAGGIAATFSATGIVTFNTPVRLDASQPWSMNGSRGTLLWNNPVNLNGKTLTITGTGVQEFPGGFSGAGNLVKTGTGRAVIDGSITGGGGCSVQEGTMEFNHASMSKTVSLTAPGIVSGTGTVTSLVTSGGSIRPGGNLTGVLSVAGAVMLNSTAQLDIELNGNTPGTGYDQLAAGSSVSLNHATLNLTLESGYTPLIGKPVVIVNNLGADPVVSAFGGLPEGATIVKGTITFRISYAGGTDGGNDVTLTPITVAASGVERVWTGAVNQLWTTPGNWAGGVAPQPGDNVQFPEVAAAKKNTVNNLPHGFPLNLVRLTAGGYTLGGAGVAFSDGIVQQAPAGSAENLITFDLATAPPSAPASVKRVRLQGGGPLTVDPSLGFGLYSAGSALVLQNDQPSVTLTSRIFVVGDCAVAKHGAGPVLLDEVSQHTGGTHVYAGRLHAAAQGSLGTGVVGVDSGAVLEMGENGAPGVNAWNQLDLSGTLKGAAGTTPHEWTGPVKMENGLDGALVSAGAGMTIAGRITGDGGLHLSGSGPIKITGIQDNDYTGATVIDGVEVTCSKAAANTAIPGGVSVAGAAGKLITTVNYSIAVGSDVTVTGGAAVTLGGIHILKKLVMSGASVATSSDLTLEAGLECLASAQTSSLSGKVHLPNYVSQSQWAVADGAAHPDLSFTGAIQYSGAGIAEIVKSGLGDLSVANSVGSMMLQFQLRIDAGHVHWLHNPVAGMPLWPRVVLNGGSLSGTGRISTLDSSGGGLLSPGGSPGALFTGELNLRENVTCSVELTAADCDALRVTGDVNCGNALLDVTGEPPAYGDTRVIIDNDGSDAVSGNFIGLPEGAVFPLKSGMVQITYTGGNGNDVALSRVAPPAPEESSFDIAGNIAGGGQPGAPPVRYSGTGIPGFNYALEISSDLQTWVIAVTAEADSGGNILLQWSPPTIPARRFFRVRAL